MVASIQLADAASVMSVGHVAIEVLFVALTIFAIWFSNFHKSRGVLK